MLGIDSKTARPAWAQAAIFAAVVLLIALVWVLRKTLLVFATALMFAYLLYPLVDAIDRHSRKSRTLAVALPFFLIFGLVAAGGWYIKAPWARSTATSRITSTSSSSR